MENKKVQGTVQLILGFMDRIKTDHIGAYAAQAAYFLIMSFIPFVLVLTALVQHHRRGIHKECGGRTNLSTFCTVVLR